MLLLQVLIVTLTAEVAWAASRACGKGEFRCNTSRLCVPQHRNCDHFEDCPDGSDEWNCLDTLDSNFWDHLYRKSPAADLDEEKDPNCGLRKWKSSGCTCVSRAVVCSNLGLTEPPPWLPRHGIELLDLTGNSFPILSAVTMATLPDVEILALSHSGVKRLQQGAFLNTPALHTLHLDNNELESLPEPMFQPDNVLEMLILGHNKLSVLPKDAFKNLQQLRELDLRQNLLDHVHGDVFKPLTHLETLYLNQNQLKTVPQFGLLPSLQLLSLANNQITTIHPTAFSQLQGLKQLFLSWNLLSELRNGSFDNLPQLLSLNLNGNRIRSVEPGAFRDVLLLISLQLKDNDLRRVDDGVFLHLQKLHHIYFDEFTLCSTAAHVPDCQPKGDGISSLEHLLDNIVLRVSVLVMAVLACTGNVVVLLGRLVAREPNPVHSLYIKTLALADLLMGVYLLIIAAADWHYRGVYIRHDFVWRHSPACKTCGFLSTLSCQASVLILTLITRDRLVSVTRPLDRRQPSLGRATLLVVALWLVAAVVAALPLCSVAEAYFGGEFYGGNGVCLPLHIRDPFAEGWEYSAAMFIALNTAALVFIGCAYWRMLLVVRSSGLSLRSTQERQDRAVAQRFVVIVATDCLCWIPIIGVKMASLAGVQVNQQVNAWLAVLVLPVNSALNPVLYTLTTSFFKNQMSRLLHALKSRDTGPSPDSAASLSNMQLSVLKRHLASQPPTRSSTLRSHGSYKSLQGTAV